ncbi:MAG: hypothetical protein PUG15_00750 [Bacteroidales bacterium]|nr:hypothetical protein [Bacteroidales bacterium]
MHFFIDHNSLLPQNLTDAFAVDSNDPMNKFNISSRFSLTGEAKVFACQDGLMIVQQSDVDDSLVNIILKPNAGLDVPYNSVKYYVYRGVRKDSFIIGTSIVPEADGNTETVGQLWRNYKNVINNPGLADPTPQCFGYDSVLARSLDVESIYDNTQTDIRALFVKEGEWIGNAGTQFPISLEIITTDNSNVIVDLNYLRAENFVLDVTGLTGLELKSKKEQLLSFIDPAAFFGIHYDAGVKISTYNGNEKFTETKKNNDIYTLLVSKFATKNTVYLDIRSEYGYSYNFYGNYGDNSGNNIKVGNSSVIPVAQEYSTNGWPILTITQPITTTDDTNNIKINLRVDDNTKPILFFENTNILGKNNYSRVLNEKDLLNGNATDWSKELTFVFPNTGAGSSKDNVAYYLKLQYFRQEFNQNSPNTVIKSENYFNSAFCPIDLPNLGNIENSFKIIHNPNWIYLTGILPNTDKRFGYVAKSGAYWDNDRILFLTEAVFAHQTSEDFYTCKGIENKFSLNNDFLKFHFSANDININCKILYEETGINEYVPIKSISIAYYNGFLSAKENLLLLGIKRTEMQSLITATDTIDTNTLSNLSDRHHRYLYLEEDGPTPKVDKNGIPFRKFKLKVQGLAPNGEISIITPDDDVFLYTRDGVCFTSKEFAEYETINNAENLVDIISLDVNKPYNSVKRLSMSTFDTFDWQLYDMNGIPLKYEIGEVNYAGDSIANQAIKLPVGTRTIILGQSKSRIDGFYCYYIVCFHEGRYREGFVNIEAFKNSNKGEGNLLLRTNYLEGVHHPQVIWRPFLDDAKRVINYCEHIIALEGVFSPFKELIIDTRNKFNLLLETFTPYTEANSLIVGLQQLDAVVHSIENISGGVGNIALNPNDKVDTINRWLEFTPLKSIVIDNVTGGFRSLVLPISMQWIEKWKDLDETLKNIFNDCTEYIIPDSSQQSYKFSDILEVLQGYGAENIFINEERCVNYLIKHVLKTLIVSFKSRKDSFEITKTPEAMWLKSLNEREIDAISNFIVIKDNTWSDTRGASFSFSEILTDHSIGYVNNVTGLSCLIHELNTFQSVTDPITGESYGSKVLYFDTHGTDILNNDFGRLQTLLLSENSVIDYFSVFQNESQGSWLAFATNPHMTILYLNYYLTKLLQL